MKKRKKSSAFERGRDAFANENDLEDECCRVAFDEYGFLSLKQVAKKGLPDRVFFRDGYAFFVEFKDTGKDAEPYQKHIHKKLRDVGMYVYVIDSLNDFVEACNEQSRRIRT